MKMRKPLYTLLTGFLMPALLQAQVPDSVVVTESPAEVESPAEIIEDPSDAAQRVFDNGFRQPADSIWEMAALRVQPEFPGGQREMMRYMQRTISYPAEEEAVGVEGRVFVQFVVDKTGKVTDVEVKRGVSHGLDAEAVRAVRAMPNWTPGMLQDRPVRVRYVLPIMFKMAEPVEEAPEGQ